MKKDVGLWIDHYKTVIVTVENEVDMTREIRSNLEKHVRQAKAPAPKAPSKPREAAVEDVREKPFGDHLNGYYEGVVSMIRGADSIWIFGPGGAKLELASRLKHAELGGLIVGVDAAEKMTERQIVSKVRARFIKY